MAKNKEKEDLISEIISDMLTAHIKLIILADENKPKKVQEHIFDIAYNLECCMNELQELELFELALYSPLYKNKTAES